jgi:HPt (histidine-containing phosphotransfer) domain-containing protein
MDMHMPRMDGLEATRSILAAAGDGAPRIVAVTASVTREDRAACAAAGMRGYVTKPVTVQALRAVLKEVTAVAASDAAPPPRDPDRSPAAPPPAPAADLVDRGRVAALRELNEPGEPDLYGEVATLFLDEAPTRLAEIRAALAAGNAEALYRAAHAVKGAARNVGAARIGDAAEAVEKRGRAGDLEGMAACLDALDAAVGASAPAIRAVIAETG